MKKNPIQNLVILAMITLYIVGAGYVVLYGAQFYTKMVKESKLSLNQHTVLLYFNNRIKTHDASGEITLTNQNGISALCFDQNGYYTLVYELDGYLVEQSSETKTIDPLDTQKIVPLTKLSFAFEDHAIVITYTDQTEKEVDLRYTLISGRVSS